MHNIQATISVIIVNWNAGSLLRDCISSIGLAKHDGFALSEVVVVDNASTDDSLNGIDQLKVPVTIIRNRENRGFAAACNQAAAVTSCDYLLFLNPDTLLYQNSLSLPISFMEREENSMIGICGVNLIDKHGISSTSCARFPSVRTYFGQATGLSKLFPNAFPTHLMNAFEFKGTPVIDQIIGAFFMIRGELFRTLKGFDERFFVYFEEVDLSLRAKKLGYSSYLLTQAIAFHEGGGCSRPVKATRLFYSLRSRLQYGSKHFSLQGNLALIIITVFLEFGSRIIFSLITRRFYQLKVTLCAYQKLFIHFILGRKINDN